MIECQRCQIELHRRSNIGPAPKYCVACSKEIKMESQRERRKGILHNKSNCENCSKPIDKTNAPAKRYCNECGPAILKKKSRESIDKYREKIGIKVGVGSGNNQGFGKDHHSYTTGIQTYRRTVIDRGDTNCNRCGVEIDFTKHYDWAAHHIDHDRTNNVSENLELLCKKCHQHEHDCFGHKKKNHNISY